MHGATRDEQHGAGAVLVRLAVDREHQATAQAVDRLVERYPGPDGKRPSDLAAEANMSRQATNYLLGQLERLGYVERRGDHDDARAKRVYETERGFAARQLLRDTMRALEAGRASSSARSTSSNSVGY